MTVTRGTSNSAVRGSSEDRRRRRAYLMVAYASDVEGFVRCYRCGGLLFNEDDTAVVQVFFGEAESRWVRRDGEMHRASPITVDRIIPGCKGGTYRRSNIRPACAGCNSETGGRLVGKGRKR